MTVEFRLVEVAGSSSLTLVFFPAVVLLAVLGVRFGYYARRNSTRADLATQTPIWNHLAYVGVLAAAYGVLATLEIVSTLRLPYKSSLVLAMALLLAFAIREVHAAGNPTGVGDRADLASRAVLVGMVLAHLGGTVVGGPPRALAGLEGVAALAMLAYGGRYYAASAASTRLQGTVIDSLVRHLLPVLVFAALVNVTVLAFALGVDRAVVPHVQVIFIVMTATAMMTATIKLRQNLASL